MQNQVETKQLAEKQKPILFSQQLIPTESYLILPTALYQSIIATYLSPNDLIQLALAFEEIDFIDIFPDTFWKKQLEKQYNQLLKSLSERKNNKEGQQINEMLQTKKYRDVYAIVKLVTVAPTTAQKRIMIMVLKQELEIYLENQKNLLENFLSKITILDMNNSQISDLAVASIAAALGENITLTSLSLGFNQISNSGVQHLSTALENNVMLITLNLCKNQIEHEGIQRLCQALTQNKSLTNLYLGGNQIGDQGAQHLASLLEQNTTLISLNLSENQIGAQGTQSLSQALIVNKTLTYLDLGWNQIGIQGIQSLCQALSQNKTLTTLYLGKCQIDAEGAQSLDQVFRQNKTLTNLYLYDNQIGVAAQNLSQALNQNKTLISLNFDLNHIDSKKKNEIDDLIIRNCELQDDFIYALKENDLPAIQKLLQQGVSPNGVLLALVHDSDAQLKSIEDLLQLTQNINFSILRSIVMMAIELAKDQEHFNIASFLQQILFATNTVPEEHQENKQIKDDIKDLNIPPSSPTALEVPSKLRLT